MIKNKQHQVPEFQVIKMNEANAKFFVASFDGKAVQNTGGTVANTYTVTQVGVGSGTSWF